MEGCPLCELHLMPTQQIILKNEHAMFLQLEEALQKGATLEGAGIIIPIAHRATPFNLTKEEWNALYDLLHEAKNYIDERFQPAGYNIGWNVGEIAGQHIPHAHLHVLPRYVDEQLACKGIRYMFKEGRNIRGLGKS